MSLVSILIPARNEADNLPALFASLEKLSFSGSKLEVWLGNDNSTDATAQLMDAFVTGKDWVNVLHLHADTDSHLSGKARVLNELIKRTSGEYLLFTDADMVLPENWVEGMLSEFTENVGVVVGVTGFVRKNTLAVMQGIEWLMALSIFKMAADLGVPSTGMGNNMAVSREAYNTIGGYEKIGFSIVEDFLLYDRIIKAGFKFKHAFTNSVLAYTVPPQNYFEQRKRWIKGALENKPLAMGAGILQAIFLPFLLMLSFVNIGLVLPVVSILVLIYAILILYFQRKLSIKGYLKYVFLFAVYISVGWFAQFMYFLFSKDTVWKGRKY